MAASIRRRLRQRLLIVGFLLALVGSLATGWLVSREVDDLLDYQLEQVARTLLANTLMPQTPVRPEDPARHLVVQIFGPGQNRYLSDPDVEVPLAPDTGFSDVDDEAGLYPEGLRVYTLRSGDTAVQVMQPISLRRSLRVDGVLDALWPALLTALALGLWGGRSVALSLRPLDALGRLLRERDAGSLQPVAMPALPRELQTPVDALNDLLARLARALDQQRRFTADAAHELRTPLSALRVQVENLQRTPHGEHRDEALADLRRGIDRCTHLIAQLLDLARQDAAQTPLTEPVDLATVARDALVDWAPAAQARGVLLELLAPEADATPCPPVIGHRADLIRAVGNLIDNAIHHAPAGTAVRVRLLADGPTLQVEDAGPGIPPSLRARALERFARLDAQHPGSGLGLPIAAEIAARHGARLVLETGPGGVGLSAQLRFGAVAAD